MAKPRLVLAPILAAAILSAPGSSKAFTVPGPLPPVEYVDLPTDPVELIKIANRRGPYAFKETNFANRFKELHKNLTPENWGEIEKEDPVFHDTLHHWLAHSHVEMGISRTALPKRAQLYAWFYDRVKAASPDALRQPAKVNKLFTDAHRVGSSEEDPMVSARVHAVLGDYLVHYASQATGDQRYLLLRHADTALQHLQNASSSTNASPRHKLAIEMFGHFLRENINSERRAINYKSKGAEHRRLDTTSRKPTAMLRPKRAARHV